MINEVNGLGRYTVLMLERRQRRIRSIVHDPKPADTHVVVVMLEEFDHIQCLVPGEETHGQILVVGNVSDDSLAGVQTKNPRDFAADGFAEACPITKNDGRESFLFVDGDSRKEEGDRKSDAEP